MRKQWTMVLASFVMMFTLATATVAQGRQTGGSTVNSGCKLFEDGSSKCGDELPPIRPGPTTTGASTAPSAFTASTNWWSVVWNWLAGF